MDAFTRPVASSQPAPITDLEREAFDVLLTASAADSLLNYVGPADLPHFDAGPRWTVQPGAELKADDYFDLAIVLCAQTATSVHIKRCELALHYAARLTFRIGKCFRPA